MARIKISDIEESSTINREDMKKVIGGSTTIRTHDSISLVKTWDLASPQLYKAVCTNEMLGEVTFNFYETESDDDDGE